MIELADWPKVFRTFGCNLVEDPGWQKRGRPYAMTNSGLMGHHNGATWKLSEERQIDISADGHSKVPGPHYQVMVGYETPATTYLVASGFCNHAGKGVTKVLEDLKAGVRPRGSAKDIYRWPASRGDGYANGAFRAVAFMGGRSSSVPTPEMQDEFARACAAFLYIDHQWDPSVVDIGAKYVEHREWTSRKPDPIPLDSTEMRARIVAAYKAGWDAIHVPPAPDPDPPFHIRGPVGVIASLDSPSGYWVIASDGGVFSYGGAEFHGSLGAIKLDAPIVGGVAVPGGYHLIGADGGVFSFGKAIYPGSAAGRLGDGSAVGAVFISGRLHVVTDEGVAIDVAALA